MNNNPHLNLLSELRILRGITCYWSSLIAQIITFFILLLLCFSSPLWPFPCQGQFNCYCLLWPMFHGPYCLLGSDSTQGVKVCLMGQLRWATARCWYSSWVCLSECFWMGFNLELVDLIMQIALLNVDRAYPLDWKSQKNKKVDAAWACSLLLWCLGITRFFFLA